MKEPKILITLRKFALIYGAGGVAALQAMKIDIFSFPEVVKIYLGYFFSIITIFCVFLGGFSLLESIKEGSDVLRRLKDLKQIEEEKQKKESND